MASLRAALGRAPDGRGRVRARPVRARAVRRPDHHAGEPRRRRARRFRRRHARPDRGVRGRLSCASSSCAPSTCCWPFPAFCSRWRSRRVLGPGLAGTASSRSPSILTPVYARLVEGATAEVRHLPYVDAVVTLGAGAPRIILRHILPNISPGIIVLTTTWLGVAVLWIAALGFIGVGVQPPLPEWGAILNDGQNYITHRLVDHGLPRRVSRIVRGRGEPDRRRPARRARSRLWPASSRSKEPPACSDRLRCIGNAALYCRSPRWPRPTRAPRSSVGWAGPFDTLNPATTGATAMSGRSAPTSSTRWSG